MAKDFNEDPNFKPWGPFISDHYVVAPITKTDVVVGGTIFGLSIIFAIIAGYIGFLQTRAIAKPLKSAYVWMIWLEIAACTVIAIECILYLLKVIRPSFYFYMSILLNWSIQVQLLLQIIINRIRVILSDRKKGQIIMISVAVLVSCIIISVFCIWIPARLQVSQMFYNINEIWDRVEKCIYLIIDVVLNWYFIRIVKRNLVDNGLGKYTTLVRFNQRMIIISLLMDVMIIAAMSIPNGFVYASFHPLAYLVKLNIEMVMANLIREITAAASQNEARRNTFTISLKSTATSICDANSIDMSARHRSSFLDFMQLTPRPTLSRQTSSYSVQTVSQADIQERQRRTLKLNRCGSERWRHYDLEDIDAMSWPDGDEEMAEGQRASMASMMGQGRKNEDRIALDRHHEGVFMMEPEAVYHAR